MAGRSDVSVWGIAMVRNEADVIGPVVAHMLSQVDHVLIADNLSTDATPDILAASGAEVIDDPDPAYRQSDKMTALATRARENGAAWVVPFDADEAWYSPFGRLGDVLNKAHQRVAIMSATMYDHVPTTLDDPLDPNPLTRVGWRRRRTGALPKVACRTHESLTIEQGNHGASYGYLRGRRLSGRLVIRHYPYRSPAQFVAKAKQGAAALALTDLPESSGAHWRQYAALAEANGDGALEDVFRQWFASVDPESDPGLIYDPAPL